MQGRRFEGTYELNSFNADPTQPTYPTYLRAEGLPGAGGPAIGSTGSQPLSKQGFFPPAPIYPDTRLLAASSYHGLSNNQQGRPAAGLIGEVSTSGSSIASTVPSAGSAGPQQQLIAKLRLGDTAAVNGQPPRPPPMGQLALVSRDQPYYGQGQRQLGPAIGQYGPGSVQSMPSIGGSTSYSGSSFGAKSTGAASTSSYGGPPIGQVGGQGFHSQPMVGALPSAQASSFISSPFVPASTSHTITGGAGSQYPMSMHPGDSSSIESVQRGASDATSGGLSNIGSISNLGSISQMGSLGMPSMPQATAMASGGSAVHRTASSIPGKVKAVCSSGGHFVKLSGGGFEYQGGETRLIAVPNFCQFSELAEALERIAGNAAAFSSASSEQSPSIKYQLPSEPNVYVDLLDDEDAQLMFDEWHEYTQSALKAANAKLHLFVDWHRRQPLSETSLRKDRLGGLASGESLDTVPASNSAGQAQSASAGSAGNSADESAEEGPTRPPAETPGAAMPRCWDYGDIAERMEVIHPKDVSLAKFLGSGGYGEVYLGKWHSSEAAIKCLNPSLFFNEGQVSQAAIAELVREADLLGSLRHPNVVWVYGMVLPEPGMEDQDDVNGDAGDVEVAAAAAHHHRNQGGVPGTVRPPAIVTEFMSQGSLKGALQRKADIVQGPLMRVLIAMDAAKGMEYLHSKRIVHFDLKSANLLLGYRDRRAICKVADFGLSKQKRETYVSGVSSQRGTLPWIAPEIIKSPHTVNEKVDVYSFGVVLWELWTGKEPYDGLNYHALLHQITTSDTTVRPALPGSPDWDPEVGPEPAPGYRALMERCWAESPAGRPSFSEIVKALKDMATALRPVRKPRPTSSNAGSSSLSQRSSKQLSQDKAAQGAAAQQKQPGPTLAVAAKDQPSKGSSQQQKQQSGQLQDGAQQLRQAPQE